ncbi:hypothetical protein INT43_004208 [Umbelopsis isabellina]|uniref:Uncharacterized protein n=1 Tax=Mortierella isabellina TaxID=91625 RepID=A0A8H7UAA6_MORIS|nr:hypothetical protein INT43_004208 [Umbelopsis isabellina]
MSSKTILITGSTDGLGRATAIKLLKQGHVVVMTSRNESKKKTAIEYIHSQVPDAENRLFCIKLDLESLESIRQAVEEFKSLNCSLDVLINNAALITAEREFSADSQRVDKIIFVNFVSTLYFTLLLEPQLHEGSRVLFVSSSLHDPEVRGGGNKNIDLSLDNLDGSKQWDSMPFYRQSKLLDVYATYLLAERLQSKKVLVNAFCPGFVPTTSLNRHTGIAMRLLMKYILPMMSFTTSEDDSSDDYVYYATSDQVVETGKYLRQRKVTESSKASYDLETAKKAWNVACEICGLDTQKYSIS